MLYIYRNTWCLNLLRNMMESAVIAIFLCQRQRLYITQIRPDENNKTEEKSSKPEAVILVPTPANSLFKLLTCHIYL